MTESPRPRRKSRKLLLPLTTLAAAGALAIGSGANFTSQSQNPNSVYASGTLSQSNSKAGGAIFNVDNLKPGDTVVGEVTIKNTGSLPAVFSLTESKVDNGFVIDSNLHLTVKLGTATIYDGDFGALGTKDLGRFNAGQAKTYTFITQLSADAGNDEQNRTATATYTWDSVQTSAVTITQGADTPATRVSANS